MKPFLPGDDDYLPISGYGVIGDLRTVALVGANASIDWCCLPELDSGSVFAALLDRHRGGRFRVRAAQTVATEQRYLPQTNVLETRFRTRSGVFTVTDFMPVRGSLTKPGQTGGGELYRLFRGEEGRVELEIDWSPRFQYARVKTRIRSEANGFVATGDAEVAALGSSAGTFSVRDGGEGPVGRIRIALGSGEEQVLFMAHGSRDPVADVERARSLLAETVKAWQEWVQEGERRRGHAAPQGDLICRAGLVLKLLTHPDTGAIAAAPTTSLPEEIGGCRNWDYRFAWLRDAAFTAQGLASLGHESEALAFLLWAKRVSRGKDASGRRLQIMYGLHGETELTEFELPHLEGYRGSRPVRVGNAASAQLQLDTFGELLRAAHEFRRIGGRIPDDLWPFLSSVADEAARRWREPDSGIWEMRREPRHFVHSKVMVWVALDRAIRMAEEAGMPGDLEGWRATREEVRRAVLENGVDEKTGAFVQAFGSRHLDASNLVIPLVGFLPPKDPRVQRTLDLTLERLSRNGLVWRYRAEDGLPGNEGAFGLATFWAVDCLALSGRLEEAEELFESMAGRSNHLGLFPEEFAADGEFLGNFPQAFTHIGLLNAAIYLSHERGRGLSIPAPMGSKEHRRELSHR